MDWGECIVDESLGSNHVDFDCIYMHRLYGSCDRVQTHMKMASMVLIVFSYKQKKVRYVLNIDQ